MQMELKRGIDDCGCLNEKIYIKKNEFIKSYERDKDAAFDEFNHIIELLTGLACFRDQVDNEKFEDIYQKLQNPKYKAVVLTCSYGVERIKISYLTCKSKMMTQLTKSNN